MQKTLVSGLILVSLLTPSLGAVQAQTAASSDQAEELRSTLISLLLQMIAQLQEQIDQILANQQAQMSNSTGGSSSSSSSTVSTGSNGSGGTGGAPSPTPEPAFSLTIGTQQCSTAGVNIPLIIGGNWRYGESVITYDSGTEQRAALQKGYDLTVYTNNPGHAVLRLSLTNTPPEPPHYDYRDLVFTTTQGLDVINCP